MDKTYCDPQLYERAARQAFRRILPQLFETLAPHTIPPLAMPARLVQLQRNIFRRMRSAPVGEKVMFLENLGSLLLKPHVQRQGEHWVVIDVGTIRSKPLPTWTAAVRYAREWHRNKYGHLRGVSHTWAP